jgi:hypothetical protein
MTTVTEPRPDSSPDTRIWTSSPRILTASSVPSAAIPASAPTSSSPAVTWFRISRRWPTSPATTIQATTETAPIASRTTGGAPSHRGRRQRSSRSTRGTKIAARMAAKTSGITRSLMSPSTRNAIASRTAMATSSHAPRPRTWKPVRQVQVGEPIHGWDLCVRPPGRTHAALRFPPHHRPRPPSPSAPGAMAG